MVDDILTIWSNWDTKLWKFVPLTQLMKNDHIFFINHFTYLPISPHEQDMTQGQFFMQSIKRLEFIVFFLIDWLPYQG